MNMDYAKFELTSKDLANCLKGIEDGAYDDLNQYEREGLLDILSYCEVILTYKNEIREALEEQQLNQENDVIQ